MKALSVLCLTISVIVAVCSFVPLQKAQTPQVTITPCLNPFVSGLISQDSILFARPFDTIRVDREPYLDIAELERNVQFPKLNSATKTFLSHKRSRYVVRVRAFIDRNGNCTRTMVEQTDSELFDIAAQKAIQNTHFIAACRRDTAVPTWTSIPVVFSLKR